MSKLQEIRNWLPYFPYDLKCNVSAYGNNYKIETLSAGNIKSYLNQNVIVKPILQKIENLINYSKEINQILNDFFTPKYPIEIISAEYSKGQMYWFELKYNEIIKTTNYNFNDLDLPIETLEHIFENTIFIDTVLFLVYNEDREILETTVIKKFHSFLLENHFDIFDLIPKGLAMDINTLAVQNDG